MAELRTTRISATRRSSKDRGLALVLIENDLLRAEIADELHQLGYNFLLAPPNDRTPGEIVNPEARVALVDAQYLSGVGGTLLLDSVGSVPGPYPLIGVVSARSPSNIESMIDCGLDDV